MIDATPHLCLLARPLTRPLAAALLCSLLVDFATARGEAGEPIVGTPLAQETLSPPHVGTPLSEPAGAAPIGHHAGPSAPVVVPPAVTQASQTPSVEWWTHRVAESLRADRSPLPITLDGVLVRALANSPQVRVFSDLPHIRRTAVAEAAATWDWSAFVESRWDDISEPVGNTLTTGDSNRFNDHNVSGSAGVRRRTRTGGSIEASQRFGWQDTNSDFFLPNQQGTSRLSLSYTQPLLRGRGRCYNESLLVLAKIDAGVADQEFSRQLQAHIVEVVRAYWGLYLERTSLVQKRAARDRAAELRDRLTRRIQLDAVVAQTERADAEVALRDSELLRAEMAVANSESRLRALVGDMTLGTTGTVELIPLDRPSYGAAPIPMELARATAVRRRPEVLQAISQIKAAGLRSQMTRHELLPALNLLTEVYVSGLEGRGDVGRSFQAQFDEGAPSYSVGLAYEVPIGNRAARARHQRKCLELRQLQSQYQTTLQTLGLEVEAAVREVTTASAEISARTRQVQASRTQLDYLTKRWQLLPGEGTTASLLLENLLDAQDRLADAEFALVSSCVTCDLAVVNVRRATGELLQCENVEVGEGCVQGLPTTFVGKRPVRGSGVQVDERLQPPVFQSSRGSSPSAATRPERSPEAVSATGDATSPGHSPADATTFELAPTDQLDASARRDLVAEPAADDFDSYFPGALPPQANQTTDGERR